MDSDGEFGYTDLEGLLPYKIPVRGVMGDSHASLLALGCLEKGMTKASYGTGSSIMMNTGDKRAVSENGLVTSIAWKRGGKLSYVLEGNVNYSAAVISWLRDDLGLISSPAETEALARSANAADTAYLVPAFTGLGMPHWNSGAKALICGMTRLTGKAEIVRAALNGIAYQIYDVLEAMEKDAGMPIDSLRVDGGASSNGYLMQFQSDILACSVQRAQAEELSAAGAAYMAGIAAGVCTDDVFSSYSYRAYSPEISDEARQKLLSGWRGALKMVISAAK